ncbi:hypothetical protein [Tautonia sociabilis]|uniref:Exosortase-associated EpsI family protein n=1 Tax=Tautonia sociabilis TaxID=2080755 RepID=A0A432MP77_9BACT|nr:hypothetical protein [Tautonia sociabilis]RUL88878.1 hypothetical protein TsocGM_04515 [Tautonia sociabilis]
MMRRTAIRALSAAIVALGAIGAGGAGPGTPGGLTGRRVDPAQVLPMHLVVPEARAEVAEIISEHSFHHRGEAETFPCDPQLYLSLLNEPALTLALWQDLSSSPVRLTAVAPGVYQGTDGNGTTATWSFVLRSPQLHVLLCRMEYHNPKGSAHLEGRIVLVVRTSYYKEATGAPWIQHEVEAFVKIDSRGWRAVARTFRPLIERLLVDQLQEAGWFVSLMGRLVETYPNWAEQVVSSHPGLPSEIRGQFLQVVARVRRPNSSPGRPELAEEVVADTR